MRLKKLMLLLLITFILTSCTQASPIDPSATDIPKPSATFTQAPPLSTSTVVPTLETIFEPVAYALTDMDVPRFRLLQSFPGVTTYDPNPPTASIAAGPDRIVLMHDNGAEIRKKNGELISGSNLINLFKNEYTDTRTVYDWYAQKFILLGWGFVPEPSCQPGECVADIYMAISRDSSPDTFSEEDWMSYRIDGTLMDNEPRAIFPDWTMIGFDKDHIVITSHSIRFSSAYEGAKYHENIGDRIWMFNRNDLGDEQQLTKWTEFAHLTDPQVEEQDQYAGRTPFNLHPAMHLTSNGTFFFASQAESKCGITVWGINSIGKMETAIANSPGVCSAAPHIPQPNGAPFLFRGNSPKILVQPIYNNGSLWVTHFIRKVINGKDLAVARWLEIDVSNWPNNVHIIQEGFIEDPNNWIMHPAIMVNHRNDMMLVYGKSGENFYPSLLYTGRLDSDPLNTIRPETILKIGGASLNWPNDEYDNHVAYGGYFGVSLDPSDNSVWMSGEYGGYEKLHTTWVGQGDWETMLPVIAEVSFDESPNPHADFDIFSAEILTEKNVEYKDFLTKGINIKVLLSNLDTSFMPEDQLKPSLFCVTCSGWINVGYDDGYNVVILHFPVLKTGKNKIKITAFGVQKEIMVTYDPSIHRIK